MAFKFTPTRPCKATLERWIPEADDGATFTPGHRAIEQEWDLVAGNEFLHSEAPGTSLKILYEPEEEEAPPAAA